MLSSTNLSFTHIAYLVFQSVLQVVFVSLAGFWSAYTGLLPKNAQKIISVLNVDLFTPCLIYSKMAKTLSLARILEIAVIPIFFGVSTLISYVSGSIISKLLKLDTDETNFVLGNSIFGNSNSLPVSLTLSLAYTLPNLAWDQIPNDDRDNVAARGLLYLLIFQQFGQMLRWSWGYNKLLKWSGENLHHMPPSQIQLFMENGTIARDSNTSPNATQSSNVNTDSSINPNSPVGLDRLENTRTFSHHATNVPIPIRRVGTNSMITIVDTDPNNPNIDLEEIDSRLNSDLLDNRITDDYISEGNEENSLETTPLLQESMNISTESFYDKWHTVKSKIIAVGNGIKRQLNPPLYSMLLGILIACFPSLQKELYRQDGFLFNTFSSAVAQIGSVSIPLILIVLGSNLYPSGENFKRTRNSNKLIMGSIIGRMILPSCFLLPIITVAVKYINVSILDDPIFLIVGFLLTVSPPAIQLTQITQLNEFFEAEMVDILFWGYVVLSLPVSIIVVSGAIYVLQWANPS